MKRKAVSFTREDTKAVKAIAIFLMLWHHLFCFPGRIYVEYHRITKMVAGIPLEQYLGGIGKLCVGIFLLMGGFGTYLSYKKHKSEARQRRHVLGKIAGLYICYWKVFFIAIPIAFLLHSKNVNWDISQVIWNFLGVNISFNLEWWFFTTYVALTLLSPFIIKFVDSKRLGPMSHVTIVILSSLFCTLFLPKILELAPLDDETNVLWNELKSVLSYLPFFAAGCIIARYDWFSKIKQKFGNNYLYCLFSLVAIMICIWLRGHSPNYYDLIFSFVIISASIVLLTAPILKYPKKLLVFIGGQSTNMWLLHSFFCYHWIQRIIFMPRYPILIFCFLVAVSLAAGLILDAFWKIIGRIWCKINIKEKLQYKPNN